ncbi:MAG: glycoside hydrolase family 3 protein [Deltaproteobacteria bacterium]|nr:glycoside hydrolase family 3 protein [Deltaproteobacteria bacterium]
MMAMDQRQLAAKCFIGLPGPDLDPETAQVVEAFPPAGVILFARNLTPEAAQIKGLISRLQKISLARTGRPMAIAIDQEGGPVKRLPSPFGQYPAAASFGPQGQKAVFEWGLKQGRELFELNITMNLAPVLDINVLGQEGVMKDRAYGSDPEVVSRLGLAAIKGLQAAGVAACAKHFPGMGQTASDPHAVRPRVDKSLDQLLDWELIPFKRAISQGLEAIMLSHLVYTGLDPDRPASLSRAVITDLLKGKLGFSGLVLTDDLDMGAITCSLAPEKAALAALEAGADRVLLCQDLASYIRLVEA